LLGRKFNNLQAQWLFNQKVYAANKNTEILFEQMKNIESKDQDTHKNA